MPYNQQHVFVDGEKPTAAHFNTEFQAIEAVLDQHDADIAAVASTQHIINAADSAYAPLGTESNATRVKNAIDAAVAEAGVSARKVVWVPKSMWGYSANADFATTMFNSAVLVVREGALFPCYDPVAYGADLTGTTDAKPLIDVCYSHAKLAVGPAARVVAFTVAGTYRITADVTQEANVGTILYPDVVFNGGGKLTGTPAWSFPKVITEAGTAANKPAAPVKDGHIYYETDTNLLQIGDGGAWVAVNASAASPQLAVYDDNAASGTKRTSIQDGTKRLSVRAAGTTDASGFLKIDFNDASWGSPTPYDVDNIHSVVARESSVDGNIVSDVTIDSAANLLKFKIRNLSEAVQANVAREVEAIIEFTA